MPWFFWVSRWVALAVTTNLVALSKPVSAEPAEASAGSERTGSERTGSERTGSERTGSERTGSEAGAGPERAATTERVAPTKRVTRRDSSLRRDGAARSDRSTRPDRYDISVLTFGPGDHPFLKFGHNAVRVHDRATGLDLVYNFGTFDFESDSLIQDFLGGRLRYWLSVWTLESALAPYARSGRSAVEMELNLTAEQEARLVESLERNALPENREYLYDYYQDNCSTRIRDLLDEVTAGALHDASQTPAQLGWREHTLRLTQDDVPVALGLHVLLGPATDGPRSQWQEMFLPEVLAKTLEQATVTQTVDGEPRELPLVKSKKVLLQPAPDRVAMPTSPPTWWPVGLLLGAFVGASAWALSWGADRTSGRRSRRALLAGLWSLTALIGVVAGLLSAAFLLLWTTNHQIAYANNNLLSMPPWSLAMPVLALAAPFWARAARVAFWLSVASLLTCAMGILVNLLPFSQDSTLFVALMLPVWLGLSAAFRRQASPPPA